MNCSSIVAELQTHRVHQEGTLLRSLCFDLLLYHTVIHIFTQLQKLLPLMGGGGGGGTCWHTSGSDEVQSIAHLQDIGVLLGELSLVQHNGLKVGKLVSYLHSHIIDRNKNKRIISINFKLKFHIQIPRGF